MATTYLSTVDVSQGALAVAITHQLNNAAAIVVKMLPNWLTDLRVASKQANALNVQFSNQAPSGAQIDIKIIG